MIKKLRGHTKEELLKMLEKDERGKVFGSLFGDMVTDQPPTTEEIVNKINEIIDYLNKKGGE